MIRNAKVIEEDVQVEGVVSLGCFVKVRDIEFDEIMEYKIVGTVEADPMDNRISNESPVGAAVLGRRVGETVDVATPMGLVKFEILEVSNG